MHNVAVNVLLEAYQCVQGVMRPNKNSSYGIRLMYLSLTMDSLLVNAIFQAKLMQIRLLQVDLFKFAEA